MTTDNETEAGQAEGTPGRVPRRKRHGARHRARRRAVDILYEAENRDTDPVALVEEREALWREDHESIAPIAPYTREIVTGVAEELDAVDDLIERFLSADWELHRIPAVDRAILRVSVWELRFNPDIPAPIGVVEGVELASEYSEPTAAGYINALLDDVAQASHADSPMSSESPMSDDSPVSDDSPMNDDSLADESETFPEGDSRDV